MRIADCIVPAFPLFALGLLAPSRKPYPLSKAYVIDSPPGKREEMSILYWKTILLLKRGPRTHDHRQDRCIGRESGKENIKIASWWQHSTRSPILIKTCLNISECTPGALPR